MRQWILCWCLLSLSTALVGCQTPACRDCNGGRAKGLFASRGACASGQCGGGARMAGGCGPGGCGLHQPQAEGPPGPPVGQYAYPYYTLRGPRDFLQNNPPSIGP